MFGRRQTTAMEYKPVPVNYEPVTAMADLQPDDMALFTANGGRVALVARVRDITRDGKPLFERMNDYDEHLGEGSYYVFSPGKTWRFVGGYRTA